MSYFSETDIINMLEFIASIPLSLKQRIPQIQIGLPCSRHDIAEKLLHWH
jgi:hypothetical protein